MLGVIASALCLLWAVQSFALMLAGEPLAWPLRFKTRKPLVKWTSRVMIHTTWLIILIGTPLALGMHARDALHQAFPMPVPWRDISVVFLIMFIPPWFVYAWMIKAGWVRIEPQHDQATRRGKLFRRFLGPLPLATLEEAVFRGVFLNSYFDCFRGQTLCTVLAIALSSACSRRCISSSPSSRQTSLAAGLRPFHRRLLVRDLPMSSAGAACGCRSRCTPRRYSSLR